MKGRSKNKYSTKEEKILFLKISIVLLIGIIGAAIITAYILSPKLELETNYIEVNVNEEFKSINYKAYQMINDLSSEVKVDGNVDTTVVGDYEMVYTLEHDFYIIKKVLSVKVVDKISPEITLKGNSEYYICDNKEYNEEGYNALDNYDGDITNLVSKDVMDDKILYFVRDSSGNYAAKERTIIKGDKESPKIILNGNQEITLLLNQEYTEFGATAQDNCDGDVSASLKIEGSVDTSNLGEYTITYKATDTKGNVGVAYRKVIVKEEEIASDENNTTGEIYLTFDDGPSSYTASILDTLKKYNIKASFFVTKNGSDEMIKREYDEGHTIALHTYTHDWDIYKTVDTYLDDLNKISNRVKNITGYESKYVRFPGGSTNQKVYHRSDHKLTIKDFINALNERGYKYFDWNVCVEDAGACVNKSDKKACVYNYFKSGLKPNRQNIVLLHDVKSYTAESLENMIKYGLAKGYTFKAIDDNTDTAHMRNFD